MNPSVATGAAMALGSVAAYVAVALARKKQKPELSDALGICIGAFSIPGAARLVAFVFGDQFKAITRDVDHESWMNLSPDDTVFFLIGGIALAWVSIQAISNGFKKVW